MDRKKSKPGPGPEGTQPGCIVFIYVFLTALLVWGCKALVDVMGGNL